jgi:hypothetical protein
MRGFVVTLSNGQVVMEKDGFTWLDLQELVNKRHLRIAKMHLQFDHQQVFLPNHARVYFYSKKVEAYLGGNQPAKQYYGVGASITSSDAVTITWYDGVNGREEQRIVDKDSAAFIIAT